MRIDVRTDIGKVQAKLDGLKKDIQHRAIARALNDMAAQARTRMSKEVRDAYAVKRADIDPRLTVRRAREGAFGAMLTATLEAFPARKGRRARNVIMFSAKETGKLKGKRKGQQGGVTVRIRRDKPRQLIRGAFIGNRGRTVFRRTGEARLPIEPVLTIDLPQMFNARRINDRVMRFIRTKFPEVMQRHVTYYASRAR